MKKKKIEWITPKMYAENWRYLFECMNNVWKYQNKLTCQHSKGISL